MVAEAQVSDPMPQRGNGRPGQPEPGQHIGERQRPRCRAGAALRRGWVGSPRRGGHRLRRSGGDVWNRRRLVWLRRGHGKDHPVLRRREPHRGPGQGNIYRDKKPDRHGQPCPIPPSGGVPPGEQRAEGQQQQNHRRHSEGDLRQGHQKIHHSRPFLHSPRFSRRGPVPTSPQRPALGRLRLRGRPASARPNIAGARPVRRAPAFRPGPARPRSSSASCRTPC